MKARAFVLVVVLSVSLFTSLTPLLDMMYNVGAVNQNGVPKNAIRIQTARQLVAIGGKNSTGKYYILDNDIDLVDEWVPIDDFRGTFDGQGYNINNLYIRATSNRQYAGLFGEITVEGAQIKNLGVNISFKGLTVTNFDHGGYACAGGLIGYSEGAVTIENCYATGTITATGHYNVCAGGLVGYDNGGVTVENCYATGTITATGHYNVCAGGLIGISYINSSYNYGNRVTVTDCYATGTITATIDSGNSAYAGGLVGRGGVDSVENCHTTGDVTSTGGSAYAGGLVGSGVGSVENCYATGTITANAWSGSAYAGGLIGSSCGPIKNSYTTGVIKAIVDSKYRSVSGYPAFVGGLVGCANGVTIENCYATGDISVVAWTYNVCAGGLVGESMGGNVTIKNSYATGAIKAVTGSTGSAYEKTIIGYTGSIYDKAWAGGLIGYSWDGVTVEHCYTTGDVSTSGKTTCAGSLVGDSTGGVVIKNCYRLSTQKTVSGTTGAAGKPLTSEEMKSQKSFKGWNFRTIWNIDPNINEGYPCLRGTGLCDDGGLFGSFWFVALLAMVVLVVVGVVCMLLRKRFS